MTKSLSVVRENPGPTRFSQGKKKKKNKKKGGAGEKRGPTGRY